jgi:hypothetical protein
VEEHPEGGHDLVQAEGGGAGPGQPREADVPDWRPPIIINRIAKPSRILKQGHQVSDILPMLGINRA